MILEAFAEYLHEADPRIHSSDVLALWLLEKLSIKPTSPVEKVLQLEIFVCQRDFDPDDETWVLNLPKTNSVIEKLNALIDEMDDPEFSENPVNYVFKGTSHSGIRLLKSLDEYSKSYENQKWARWVHQVKASDFKKKKKNNS